MEPDWVYVVTFDFDSERYSVQTTSDLLVHRSLRLAQRNRFVLWREISRNLAATELRMA